jgi:hypothetical protein
MKNIHILPTENSSRLSYNKDGVLELHRLQWRKNTQNIYITNDEEIKEGDYYYLPRTNSAYKCIEDATELNLERRLGVAKIILTTDQDLIKDGVQAIDDEFLEWFVKNPSCEFVEVRKEKYSERFDNDKSPIGNPNTWGNRWLVIIPKEETNIISDWLEQNRNPEIDKQVEKELEYLSKQEIKLEDVFNDDKKANIKKFIDEIINPSQPNQALKDAAERLKGRELFKESNDRARKILSEIKLLPIQDETEHLLSTKANRNRLICKDCNDSLEDCTCIEDTIEFPKQEPKQEQERSYSEEEVIAFGEFIFKHSLLTHTRGVKSLFEQFKKK